MLGKGGYKTSLQENIYNQNYSTMIMVISFSFNLKEALEKIKFGGEKRTIVIERTTGYNVSIVSYGKAKWAIVDLLNESYSHRFNEPINLHNWLNYNESDEVSYFLNEAGSNTLNYADGKISSTFHLWRGEKGFVIGIEQDGNSFDALRIDTLRLRENEGAGFDFYRKCRGTIFFDDKNKAKIIYFMQTWP